MKIVYLDTETTGLNPGQICELSAIVETDLQFTLAKNFYFKVDTMTEGAYKTHGMSIEQLTELSHGETFGDHKDELLDLLSGATLVAHNIPFDEKFISQEFWRCGISFRPLDRLDSMEYFKPVLRLPARSKKYGPFKNPKLSEVIDYYGISHSKIGDFSQSIFGDSKRDYHDSMFDTTALYVMINVRREILNGGNFWYSHFCRE